MLCCGNCDSKKLDEANFNEALNGEVTPHVDTKMPSTSNDRTHFVPSLPSKAAPPSPGSEATVPAPATTAAHPPEGPKEPTETKSPGEAKMQPKMLLPKIEAKITPEQYRQCWEENTNWMAYGGLTGSNEPFKERELEVFGPFEAEEVGVAFTCRKGQKGEMDTAPNQDNFSVAEFKNGWRMACCMDGHGSFGQLVATMAAQTLPYLLARSDWKVDEIPNVLIEAYEQVHSYITAIADADGWSVDTSGCAAVLVLWKDKQAYVSHVGDSRVIVGSQCRLLHESGDHKPSTKAEKQRIEQLGGEVHTEVYPDGWTEHRIFVKNTEKPGLSMSRSLGDTMVKEIGVIATPDVKYVDLSTAQKPFIILASDGVWEFLTSDTVCRAATSTLQGQGVKKTAKDLYEASLQCWRNAESDYCDDITAVLIDLSPKPKG